MSIDNRWQKRFYKIILSDSSYHLDYFSAIINFETKLENNKVLFIITGLSGAGKTTLANHLINDINKFGLSQMSLIVSYTTRTIRDGELEGVDYFFVSREVFLKMLADDQFLETVEYAGNFYGTPKDYDSSGYDNYLLVADIAGAVMIKNFLGSKAKLIFIFASEEELSKRLLFRGQDDNSSISKRVLKNREDMIIFEKEKDKFDLVIENIDQQISSKIIFDFVSELIT